MPAATGNAMPRRTPEEIAEAVLKNVKWGGTLPIAPVKIAACYGVSVTYDESLMNGTKSGYCVNLNGKAPIIVNPADPTVRQRFTIAHELVGIQR